MGRYKEAWQGSFPYIKECRSCDYADWGLGRDRGRCLRTDGKCPYKIEGRGTKPTHGEEKKRRNKR